MTSRFNALDQQLDIKGSLVQDDTRTLTDETAFLGAPVTGQTGAAASVGAFGAGVSTMTGLTGMTADSVGRFLTVSGAATGGNNGTFLIITFNGATSVDVSNVAGGSPDANDGSIVWAEREPYSLLDDLDFERTDRSAIKGVSYNAAIPVYQRPTAIGTNVPANLTNIADKTTDARGFILPRSILDQNITVGSPLQELVSAGNIQHSDAVDKTGVPLYDVAPYVSDDTATYVKITSKVSENELVVLGGGNAGNRIFGRTRAGTNVAATGSITTVGGGLLIDGETFTLDDGVNAPTVFEFDLGGGGVGGGNVAVVYTAPDTADVVKATIIAAVNGVGAGLEITAGDGGVGLVTLTNDNIGGHGNQTVTETVADAGFVVAGLSGGSGSVEPNSVEVEFRSVAFGTDLSTSVAYTWEVGQETNVGFEYGYFNRLDLLPEDAFRKLEVLGITSDGDLRQDVDDLQEVVGINDGDTDLSTHLTNTGNFFPFVNLPDGTPSVVEALNTLNEQIGNRDYSATAISNVSGLADGQTITASIEALALAIGASTITRTIERLAAVIPKNTAHTIPGAQTYTLDGSNNGQNMWVYTRGVLRDPGTVANGDDYAETSTTQVTFYSKLNAGDHINYFILQ